MAKPASQKRVVGLALFGSGALTILVAILIGTGVVPIDESVRPVLVGALVLVAFVDALIGWRFLLASSE